MAKQTPRSSKKRASPYKTPKTSKARRKLNFSGPSRTMVPVPYHRPQLKWNIGKQVSSIPLTSNESFMAIKDHSGGETSLFNIEHGTQNHQRVGNTVTAREIQIKYSLPPFYEDGSSMTGNIPNTEQNLWLVRDTEPHGTPPSNWAVALFDESAGLSSRWTNNFRNADYTNRFQIVKALNLNSADSFAGRGEMLNGYMTHTMNSELKYPTGQSGIQAPTNVRYYLLYHVSHIDNTKYPSEIQPEITVKTTYVDN